MPRIEIKYDRKTYTPLLIIGGVGVIIGIFYFLFNESNKIPTWMVLCILLIFGLALAGVIGNLIKVVKREPVLIFIDEYLYIHEQGYPIYIPWEEIVAWDISQDKENNSWNLTVETRQNKHSVTITYLERTPEEIDLLLKRFKGQL